MRSFVLGLIISALILTSVFCGCNVVIDPESDSATSEIVNHAQSFEDDRESDTQSGESSAKSSSGSSKPDKPFNGSEVAEAIEVKGETCSSDDLHFLVLTLTNKSGSDCNLDLNVEFMTKKRKRLGNGSRSFFSFQSGTTIAAVFECEEKFSRYEYTLEVADLSYYECADKSLKCSNVTTDDTTIISVTNNGESSANSIEYLAVYYKDGELTDYRDGYVVGESDELKPKQSANAKAKCESEFDDVKVYIHGRAKPQ